MIRDVASIEPRDYSECAGAMPLWLTDGMSDPSGVYSLFDMINCSCWTVMSNGLGDFRDCTVVSLLL